MYVVSRRSPGSSSHDTERTSRPICRELCGPAARIQQGRIAMYEKPKVERFGSLRELTQWGGPLFLLQGGLLPGCGPSGGKPKKCQGGDPRS